MVRLIATDLDGTLVPSGRPVPEPVLAALQEALDRQIQVVPASGRSLAAFPEEILGLSGLRYVISSNGAMIQDIRERRLLRQVLIEASDAAEILRMLYQEGLYSCVYSGNKIYNWRWLPSYLERYYASRMSIFRQNPQEDLAAFVEQCGSGVEKLFIAVHDPRQRERIRQNLGKWPDVRITSSSSWNLEVNRQGADKGSALAWLADWLRIPQEETAALGDNENDRTMLAFAGHSAAPENGTKEAKMLARELFPPCEDGGAAVFLKKILLDR